MIKIFTRSIFCVLFFLVSLLSIPGFAISEGINLGSNLSDGGILLQKDLYDPLNGDFTVNGFNSSSPGTELLLTPTQDSWRSRLLVNTDFNLPVQSTSPGTISYTSSNEAVATVSDNKVTIIGIGQTEIMLNQLETEDYLAGTTGFTLTVDKANQTITIPSSLILGKHIKSKDFELNATVNSGLPLSYVSNNTDVIEVYQDANDNNKWKVAVKGAGTAEVIVSQAGNDYYNEATGGTIRFVVTSGEQPIHVLWSTGDSSHNFPITTGRYHFIDALPEIDPELPGIYSVEIEVTATGLARPDRVCIWYGFLSII